MLSLVYTFHVHRGTNLILLVSTKGTKHFSKNTWIFLCKLSNHLTVDAPVSLTSTSWCSLSPLTIVSKTWLPQLPVILRYHCLCHGNLLYIQYCMTLPYHVRTTAGAFCCRHEFGFTSVACAMTPQRLADVLSNKSTYTETRFRFLMSLIMTLSLFFFIMFLFLQQTAPASCQDHHYASWSAPTAPQPRRIPGSFSTKP